VARISDIELAIASHAKWATHLTKAIADARLEIPLVTIGSDDVCEFGQWLYGQELTDDDKGSADYKNVRELHAEFHKVARQVAELAESSNRYEAYKLLYGDYIARSGKLSIALTAWKEKLEGRP
jgi:Chemoreceptor zinc-binding domain